jgi:glutathione peroxidase-family protein
LAVYGVEHISQASEVREKCKQTCLKNFGVEFPMQSKEVIEKRNKTYMEMNAH